MARCSSALLCTVLALAAALVQPGVALATGDSFCSAVDDGSGTAQVPPVDCFFLTPNGQNTFMIIDGLPPGSTIVADPVHHGFMCDSSPCGQPGGTLGGEYEDWISTLTLSLTGTGDLAGYERTISVPMTGQTHSAPHTSGLPVQVFARDMFSLQGQLIGDPDFDLLDINFGRLNVAASPGQTTLTDLGDGTFLVDSFFDIAYDVFFAGAPGGALGGMGGTSYGRLPLIADRGYLFVDGFESGDLTAWAGP